MAPRGRVLFIVWLVATMACGSSCTLNAVAGRLWIAVTMAVVAVCHAVTLVLYAFPLREEQPERPQPFYDDDLPF